MQQPQVVMQQPPATGQQHSMVPTLQLAPQHHMGQLTCWQLAMQQLPMAMQQLLATWQLHSINPSTQLAPQYNMGWLTARLLLQVATL
jgi:hypothetical protein